MTTRLQQFYRETVVPRLTQELGLKNPMQVPRITKITVNMGVGEAVADRKIMDAAVADLTKITGQKPLLCKSKKSIASFKLREGLAIGCKVTLRGARMYEFLDRLISIAIPRIRDFRGVSPRSFDGRGNYSLAWTLRSPRRRATTNRAGRCSRRSASHSASDEGFLGLWRKPTWSSARSGVQKS
jgi:large subunit ribosomal protein L5